MIPRFYNQAAGANTKLRRSWQLCGQQVNFAFVMESQVPLSGTEERPLWNITASIGILFLEIHRYTRNVALIYLNIVDFLIVFLLIKLKWKNRYFFVKICKK